MSRVSSAALCRDLGVMLILFGLLVAPGVASAQDTKLQRNTVIDAPLTTAPAVEPLARKPIGSGIRAPAGSMAVALTAQECTTLGGKSVAESVCNSGKACETRTQNGDWKRVCLSKTE